MAVSKLFDFSVFNKSLKVDLDKPRWIAGVVYQLHFLTGRFLLLCSFFIFAKEALNGHIHCMQSKYKEDEKISKDAFNSYCYIMSTFTLPNDEIVRQHKTSDYAYLGVGPNKYNKGKEEQVQYHNYYQWIGYLLFLQGMSFLLPSLLHRFLQGGRVEQVLSKLNNLVLSRETRTDQYESINSYFSDYFNRQNWWAYKLTMCDALNLANILLNIFFVDWYLDHHFLSYGSLSLDYILDDPISRGPSPFNLIFPKMTKCTMRTYGPSGTIQTHDALCVMTINVLNEKIFFVVWCLFAVLGLVTIVHHVTAFLVVTYRPLRNRILVHFVSPAKSRTRVKLARMLDVAGFGDWMMLYMVARNTDGVVFAEMVDCLTYPSRRNGLETAPPMEEEKEALQDRHYPHFKLASKRGKRWHNCNGHLLNGHLPNGHVPNGHLSNGHVPTIERVGSEKHHTII